jgi:hypothetical protein
MLARCLVVVGLVVIDGPKKLDDPYLLSMANVSVQSRIHRFSLRFVSTKSSGLFDQRIVQARFVGIEPSLCRGLHIINQASPISERLDGASQRALVPSLPQYADYNPDNNSAHAQMNPPRSNADGKGGAILTLIRVLAPGKMDTSEVELEEAHYSDWAPKRATAPKGRPQSTSVISSTPAVTFLQDDIESPHISQPINLPFALFSVAFFSYAVPTAIEFFACHHVSPWISTILPGDIAGCLWLAAAYRMRLVGLLLYVLLTASEICLYGFGLVDAGGLVWVTDLVPTFCVAAVITSSHQRHS